MQRPVLAAPEPFPGPRHALADDDTPFVVGLFSPPFALFSTLTVC
jgi:hypothetical protein